MATEDPDDDRALADFNQAIRLDPKLTEAYLNRGVLRRDRMEWDQALADLDAAIRLDAREPNAHYHRGIILFAARRGGAADEVKTVLDIQGWRGALSACVRYSWAISAMQARRP